MEVSVEIIETTALGAPGLHIADEKIAGEFFYNTVLKNV
jgi:hypothetical protein